MFLSLLHVDTSIIPGQKWIRDVYRVHQRLWMAFPNEDRKNEDPFFLGQWKGSGLRDREAERYKAGFLFRIERDGMPRILVQSVQRPNWEYAFQNAPYLLSRDSLQQPKVKEFDPVFESNQIFRFRLLANVVKSKSEVHPSGETRKTRKGLVISRRKRTEVLVHPDPMPDPLPHDPTERAFLLNARWNPWREWLNGIGAKRGFRIIDEKKNPLLMETIHTFVTNPGPKGNKSSERRPINWRFNAGLFEGILVCTDPNRLRDAIINGIGPAKAFGFGLLSIASVREDHHVTERPASAPQVP